MRSLYYRCCWHRVSNLLFFRYRQNSSLKKAVYEPKPFILHAASLGQAFAHCRIFSTAATRRCLGSVSVPVRGIMLSHPLPVIALVSRYLANKLIGHRPLLQRVLRFTSRLHVEMTIVELIHLSVGYARLEGRLPMCYAPVCRWSFSVLLPKIIRTTCMP